MEIDSDLRLARLAASGDPASKREVARIVDPIARSRAATCCRRFCGSNRQQYYCTVDSRRGLQSRDALRCEWGSLSYFFFFDALASPRALLGYEGRNGARLEDYLRASSRSVGLWERWKDKRFNRRIHVPQAVEAISPNARRVYLLLRDGDVIPNIAQRLNRPETEIEIIARKIKRVLVKERRSFLLMDQSDISLSNAGGESSDTDAADWEPPSNDPPAEEHEIIGRIERCLPLMSWLDQYIIQAMVIEGLPAEAVLQTLREQDVEIKPGQPVATTTINQVYYLRDKALARLRRIANL